MKKICFITTISVTLKTFILKTAEYLHKNENYDITFICNPDSEFKEQLPDYIHFIPVEMNRGISTDGIKVIYKLYQIFKKEKFDLIQYSTPNAALYASVAGKLAGIKVRLYCQWGIRYVGFSGLKRKIFKLIEKITCKDSTWIEPDSFGNLKFSHKEKLYSSLKSSVIWNGSANGVDLEKFNIEKKDEWRVEVRKRHNLDEEIVVGFIGRLEKDKGINELLEAYKNIKIPNLELLVVGPEDKTETINKELYEWAKGNENIIFTGKVKDVEKYYSAMDIFVLPSYREGFGSVVVEAEAMGVPVIVTNIPGPLDAMIENKTGLVVEKGNAEDLKDALEKLIKDKITREKFGEEAKLFAKKNFDAKKIYEYILEDRRRLLNAIKGER